MGKYIKEAITLKYSDTECDVLPRLAANAVRYERGGVDILRPLKSLEEWYAFPCVYGTPVLFPANRTAGGNFTFQGQEYHLPINEPARGNHLHGLLHSEEFEPVFVGENKIICTYKSRKAVYPFSFSAEFTAELDAEGLTQHFSFTNTGTTDMPYTFAIHTAFNEPTVFKVPIGKRYAMNEAFVPTGKLAELTAAEQSYIVGAASKGNSISGVYVANGNKAQIGAVSYTVGENFDHWVLYNQGGNQGYLCVEPQCGEVNGLNTQNGHRVLRPNETVVFTTNIK